MFGVCFSFKQQQRRNVNNVSNLILSPAHFLQLVVSQAPSGFSGKSPPQSLSPVAGRFFPWVIILPHLKDDFIDANECWKSRGYEPSVKQIQIKGFLDLLWTNQQGFVSSGYSQQGELERIFLQGPYAKPHVVFSQYRCSGSHSCPFTTAARKIPCCFKSHPCSFFFSALGAAKDPGAGDHRPWRACVEQTWRGESSPAFAFTPLPSL